MWICTSTTVEACRLLYRRICTIKISGIFEVKNYSTGADGFCLFVTMAFVTYGPLGPGWLVDDFNYNSMTLRLMIPAESVSTTRPVQEDDYIACMNTYTLFHEVPKFKGENFFKNKLIVWGLKKVASRKGCSTSWIALAWVTAQEWLRFLEQLSQHVSSQNFVSRIIDLTEDEKLELRKIIDAVKPHGHRYTPYPGGYGRTVSMSTYFKDGIGWFVMVETCYWLMC